MRKSLKSEGFLQCIYQIRYWLRKLLDSVIHYAHQDIGTIHKPHDHIFENSELPSNTGAAQKNQKIAEK